MAQPTDPNSAETLANRLDQAIDAGDVSAAFRIAEMYRSGENHVPRDLAWAVSLYKAAARLGNHPMAMNTLGILHEQGWGEPGAAGKVTAITEIIKSGKK